MDNLGTVYLLHFERKYYHCQHYIGFTVRSNIGDRMDEHVMTDKGSNLVKAVSDAGIKVSLVRAWKGVDRNFERKLKNRKNAPKLCPLCMKEILK